MPICLAKSQLVHELRDDIEPFVYRFWCFDLRFGKCSYSLKHLELGVRRVFDHGGKVRTGARARRPEHIASSALSW
jgi:hypothetical protein